MKINYDKETGRIKAWGINECKFLGDCIIVDQKDIPEDFDRLAGHQKYKIYNGSIIAVEGWRKKRDIASPIANPEQNKKDLEAIANGTWKEYEDEQ